MNIVSIGGGPASVIFSYLVKKNNPSFSVSIYEASDKILKRVLVSGNGRANFFNENFLNDNYSDKFTDPEEIKRLVSSKDAKDFLEIIEKDLGLPFCPDEEGRIYPFSNSSTSLRNVLINGLNKVGVKVILNQNVQNLDPIKKVLTSNGKEIPFDYLFIGIGGSAFDRQEINKQELFKFIRPEIVNPSSALCPLRTSNILPEYAIGSRLKGRLILKKNNKPIYEENGELLFKKDGISGICVFNASLFIDNDVSDYCIEFNPFFRNEKELDFDKGNYSLSGVFSSDIERYILSKKGLKINAESIKKLFTFKIVAKYNLKDSQISLGGIKTQEIGNNFCLNKYQYIMLGGEEINIHAICGGYNMGFAFLSGLRASKNKF
jgi:predicted flavoprotein YhiN